MKSLGCFLLLCFLGASVHAFPSAPFDGLKSTVTPPLSKDSSSYNFEGIVKLSNCSGAVIRFKGQSFDSNAIVLTNGHCLGGRFLRNNEFIHNKKISRRMKVADSNMRFHNIRAIELMYGTMTGTDSALYKLKETYTDLRKLGIEPFEFSESRPIVGTSIEIISGYWERGYSCEIEDFVHMLKEASWIFTDSIRYTNTGCKTIGGTSGSPIIMKNTRTVIGVNNTANESGRECTMNNPCEIDEDNNIYYKKGTSYGQQTYQFYNCLNSEYEIDLNIEGCNLTR